MTKTFKHTPKDSMSREFIRNNQSGQRMHRSIAISYDNGKDFNTYDRHTSHHVEHKMFKVPCSANLKTQRGLKILTLMLAKST